MICGPVGLVGFGWRILDSFQTDISGRGSFRVKRNEKHGYCFNFKELFTLLDLCVSSLRRGHANLLCIVPILTDDPRRESNHWFAPKNTCLGAHGGQAIQTGANSKRSSNLQHEAEEK